jgi:heme/copper-type cytochrome/quinol oxidase subunit 4
MSLQTAELLFQLIIGVMIPFVVSTLKQVHWTSSQKFMVAFGVSVVASSLVPILKMGDGPFDGAAMLESLTVIFTTSQVIYRSILKMMAVEEVINPQIALLSVVRDQIIPYLATIDKQTAADILDPNTDKSIEVTVQEIA